MEIKFDLGWHFSNLILDDIFCWSLVFMIEEFRVSYLFWGDDELCVISLIMYGF